MLHRNYAAELRDGKSSIGLDGSYPQTWKTVGDEILFCCRVLDVYHVALCVDAFLISLKAYATQLESEERHLDLKGCGWVAAFPAPNVTVALGHEGVTADQFDEEFEKNADLSPRSVDFLGNGIDSGFRMAQHAATDRFSVCAELGWLLTIAAERNLFGRKFRYHDMHPLKGVIQGRPYPIVSVDTERNLSRQRVREAEIDLTGRSDVIPRRLQNFLRAFMEDEGIDFPYLGDLGTEGVTEPPERYITHRNRWIAEAKDVAAQNELEISAGRAEDDEQTVSDLPEEVLENARSVTDGKKTAGE